MLRFLTPIPFVVETTVPIDECLERLRSVHPNRLESWMLNGVGNVFQERRLILGTNYSSGTQSAKYFGSFSARDGITVLSGTFRHGVWFRVSRYIELTFWVVISAFIIYAAVAISVPAWILIFLAIPIAVWARTTFFPPEQTHIDNIKRTLIGLLDACEQATIDA